MYKITIKILFYLPIVMNSLGKQILIKYTNLFFNNITINDDNFINYGKFTTVIINNRFLVANSDLDEVFEIKDYFKKKWVENTNTYGAPIENETTNINKYHTTIEQKFERGTFIFKKIDDCNESYNIWFKNNRNNDFFEYKINYIDELELINKKNRNELELKNKQIEDEIILINKLSHYEVGRINESNNYEEIIYILDNHVKN